MGTKFLADIPGQHTQQFRIPAIASGAVDHDTAIFRAPFNLVVDEIGFVPAISAAAGNAADTVAFKVIDAGTGAGTATLASGSLHSFGGITARTYQRIGSATLDHALSEGDILILEQNLLGSGGAAMASGVGIMQFHAAP